MFKDLKEYQDITRIYNESVNISEEQREINKIFIEEGFTLEEIEYLEENFDELWENELSGLTEECILESIREDNLTEEQLNEVLGLGMAAKLAKKAAPLVKKGIKSVKTGVKDTLSGAKTVAKSAIKKVGNVVKKAAPVLKKIPGIALPVAAIGGVAAGINKLRKMGKDKRETENKKTETKVTPPVQIGGGNAGGSTDSGGTAGGDKGGETKTETKPETKTETKPKKMHPIEKKNRARFGDAHVDKLKSKQVDFKAMRKGKMSKDDFIKKYPNSITAQKSKGLRDHAEWDAYDMVLEYLFSTEQVNTIEEANYVMMEMEQETIGSIVNDVNEFLEEGIGSVRILPALGKMALGAAAVKGVSSYLGRKSGEKSIKKTEPKKPSLIKKIKDATDAKNKAIEEM